MFYMVLCLFILSLLILMMMVYSNSLFFVFVILFNIICMSLYLVSSFYMQTLTMLMLFIVYIGAMMILIGYVCAICPNLNLSSNLNVSYFFLVSLMSYFMFSFFLFPSSVSHSGSILEFLYSFSGLSSFFVLVFMLFLTLLMVTSQYLMPKGPFRSLL